MCDDAKENMAQAQKAEELRVEMSKNNSAARVTALKDALVEETTAQIKATGEAYFANLEKSAGPEGAKAQQAAAFEHSVAAIESQAIMGEQASFSELVAHEKALIDAVQKQVMEYGYAAARNTTKVQSAAAATRFSTSARNLTNQYSKAAQVWQSADRAAQAAAVSSFTGWYGAYQNASAAYFAVAGSFKDVNDAQEMSTVAGHQMRWSAQSSRLSGDISEIANGRAEISALEAHTAELNGNQAASMVASNTAIVPVVQELVDSAEAEANAAVRSVAAGR